MKISIAMATFNGAKYLREQLQSFIDQNRQPDELIITDDGSTDSTMKIIEEFARKAPFKVNYYRNDKNLGYSGNFNHAISRTTGDLVFLSDQDDVWFGEKLAHLEKLSLENPDILLFMNDAALTDGQLIEVGLTKLGQIRTAGFTEKSFVMGCCCAVRRELLDICMPIPKGYKAHDSWIVSFAAGLDSKLISERVMQYYRRHGSNESNVIANRITKVTRWDVTKQKLKSLVAKEESWQLEFYVEQLTIFSQGIERAIQRSSHPHIAKLRNLFEITQNTIRFRRERSAIRSKRPLPRFGAAISCLVKGHYCQASGLKSALRDIVG